MMVDDIRLVHPGKVFKLFFFIDSASTEIYTLSLHDALPILAGERRGRAGGERRPADRGADVRGAIRSEEHTSELQSRLHLVCRLLLEKKKSLLKPPCFNAT